MRLLRNLKRNWSRTKKEFWDLVSLTFQRGERVDRDLLWGAMLWGTLFAVVGTPILMMIPWILAEIVN